MYSSTDDKEFPMNTFDGLMDVVTNTGPRRFEYPSGGILAPYLERAEMISHAGDDSSYTADLTQHGLYDKSAADLTGPYDKSADRAVYWDDAADSARDTVQGIRRIDKVGNFEYVVDMGCVISASDVDALRGYLAPYFRGGVING
jgi:hypothetical protein